MKIIKKNIVWPFMVFLLLAACHNEEAVAPVTEVNSTGFIAGKLATVQVAEDYEVNFWEVNPGSIIVDVYRSIEADMKAPINLKSILSTSDYTEMYKKLAGKSADREAIRRLSEAQLRANDPSLVNFIVDKEGCSLQASGEFESGSSQRTAAPIVQPKCSPDQLSDNYGAQWFYYHYVIESNGTEAWFYKLSSTPQSEFASTDSNTQYSIDVMNGQFYQSDRPDNVVRAQVTSVFNATLNPRRIRTFSMGPSRSGTFKTSFTNGLKCASTHFAFHLSNI